MDRKGRAIDNVFFERFWRTLKHEHLYLTPPTDGVELYTTRKRFVHFYNEKSKRYSIGKVTPAMRYRSAACGTSRLAGNNQQISQVLSFHGPLKKQHQHSHIFDQNLS